jgi:hypothetical protein
MDSECIQCGEAPDGNQFKLELTNSTKYIFSTNYTCNNCGSMHSIWIQGQESMLRAEIYQGKAQGIPSEIIFQRATDHSARNPQEHSARGLVEGLRELTNALDMMYVNKNRFMGDCEVLRQSGFANVSSKLAAKINTDAHNYFACAYSFSQILSTVQTDIPTDNRINTRKERFDAEKRTVMGLRIFAQHNLNLPLRYHSHKDPETEEWQTNILVELKDVMMIESAASKDMPDGYEKGAPYHYSSVDGDSINIEKLIESHYNLALKLVKAISEQAYNTRGKELKEYSQLEDPMIDILSQEDSDQD